MRDFATTLYFKMFWLDSLVLMTWYSYSSSNLIIIL